MDDAMTDMFTPERRSEIMANIHSADTVPEVELRRLVHALGYRFRLHRSDLPGKPDVVLPRHHAAIMMHGCFWHGHTCKDGRRAGEQHRVLEQEAGSQSPARQEERGRAAAPGLEMLGCLGMSVEEEGPVDRPDNSVPGGDDEMKPTIASFFSGIGGVDLGFINAGFKVTMQCEIDKFCQSILEAHWPKTPAVQRHQGGYRCSYPCFSCLGRRIPLPRRLACADGAASWA
ncbi:MAG: DNA cytosine methyltransferase [Ignavibacteriota bacterium]